MFQFQSSNILAVRPGDWEPVGRREPRPRIETSPVWPKELPAVKTVGDMLADAHRAKEADRVWRAVREAAGGTVEAEPVVEVVRVELPDWPGLCPEDLVGLVKREARLAYERYRYMRVWL